MSTYGRITQVKTSAPGGNLCVDLYGRAENGDRFHLVVNDAEPYFYIDGEPKDDERIVRTEVDGVDFKSGESLVKVVVQMPNNIKELRDKYTSHWEADLNFNDRVRYDNAWKGSVIIPDIHGNFPASAITASEPRNIEPRVCHMDIETWDEGGMATGNNPFHPIISIGFWDSFKDKYMLVISSQDPDIDKIQEIFKETYGEDIDLILKKVDSEYQILMVLKAYLETVQPDIVTGWYFKDFDWAYIQARCEKLNIYIDDSPYQIFDLLEGFKSLSVRARAKGKKHPKNLDFVGKELIGKGKVDHTRMHKMWEKDINRLCAYNLGDVYLTKEIDKVKNIIGYYMMVSEVAGCSLDDIFYNSKVVDSVIFHRLKDTDLKLPSKGMLISKPIKKGATVFEPSTGIQKNVVAVDNKAEYPSIMRSLNMSPETKVGPEYEGEVYIAPSGTRYKKGPRGIIPGIMDELMENRNAIKAKMKEMRMKNPDVIHTPEYQSLDNQQETFKYLINSFYGVLGSVDKKTGRARWRLADGDIGSDVTEIGREHVRWNSKYATRRGHIQGYGDTDSNFFTLYPGEDKSYDEIVEEMLDIVDELNESFDQFAAQFNCKEHFFKVDAKCVYENFFQAGSKKRYAGLISWFEGVDIREQTTDERIEIVGFDIIRSNTAELQQEVQEKIITMALEGSDDEEIRAYLYDIYTRTWAGEFDNKLGIPCGIGKLEYKNGRIPVHVKAAMWSNRNLNTVFTIGDKPIYWYVTGVLDTDEDTDVAALEWKQDPREYGFQIDYDRQIPRILQSDSTCSIIEAIGMSWGEIISGQKDTALEEFW